MKHVWFVLIGYQNPLKCVEDILANTKIHNVVVISENYYMRPERPVHQTLGTLKTLTANLDVASGDMAS